MLTPDGFDIVVTKGEGVCAFVRTASKIAASSRQHRSDATRMLQRQPNYSSFLSTGSRPRWAVLPWWAAGTDVPFPAVTLAP